MNRRGPRHSFVIDALAISSSTLLLGTLRLDSMLRQEEGCAGEVVDLPESEPPGVALGARLDLVSAKRPTSALLPGALRPISPYHLIS